MARFEDSQSVSSDPVVVYVEQSHFRARKSKMAAKIQDGGRKFLFLWTKKLRMVLENNHTKNGACCQSVTGISAIASTTCLKNAQGVGGLGKNPAQGVGVIFGVQSHPPVRYFLEQPLAARRW